MGVTINGHTLREIGGLLSAPFPENAFKQRDTDNSWFLPSEFFKERFDSVIGLMNYDYEIKEIRRCESVSKENGTAKPLIQVTLSVIIKDDEGVTVKKAEGVGVARAIVIKDTGVEKNANSDVAIAEQYAFKHLCQNVFNMANSQLTALNAKEKKIAQPATALPSNIPQGTFKERLTMKENFVKRGNNLYGKASSANHDDIDVVIFGKDLTAITSRMPEEQFIKTYSAGTQLALNGEYGTYNGRVQFKFKAS